MEGQENTTREIWMPLLLCSMVALGMIFGGKMKGSGPVVEVVRYHDTLGTASMEGKLEELIRYIDARYVDQIGRDSLLEDAINSLMAHLDPHSEYLSPAEVIRLRESREGVFTGIGVEFLIYQDTLHILRVLPGSPAEEKGLLPGDRILMANDSLLAGPSLNHQTATEQLKGEQGSRVRLKIQRDGVGLLDIQLRRTSIRVSSVSEGVMLDTTTGYVRIHRFGANTYREFMESIESLHKEFGMKDLLIDLRGNPGGYLHETVNILSQLFPEKDRLLVYTVGREADRREYRTSGRRFFAVERLVLLVDEHSASASEIMAGAIQDWDRGLIAGRRTYGKGLVQEQYGLRDGSAIVLTIARYYTPSGRSIQRDYSDIQAYAKDEQARKERGELTWKTALNNAGKKTYSTYNGRSVYGGGGVEPDVFIPLDTTRSSTVLVRALNQIPVFQLHEIKTGFAGPGQLKDKEALWSRFKQWAAHQDEKVQTILKGPMKNPVFRQELIRQIALYVGGESEETRVNVFQDPEIRTALQLFHVKGVFERLL
ncbi:MAG: PDZ domain-containing protein [Saprospiraceae bacterium]|nr:PDZ domain-containing protein [Saprospiraceae bacterium]